MEIILIIVAIIIITGIFLVIKFSSTKKLSKDQLSFIIKNYNKIIATNDSKHRIIDFDKLYHRILLEIGYKGSFGEILKQNPVVIGDINKVWELHKLRNKLVHEFDNMGENLLLNKSNEYQKILKHLINKIS